MLTASLNKQSIRYIINGLVATAIHFLVLTFFLKILDWDSAGVANLIAAVFGISASFIGSRYYVFNGSLEPLVKQLYRFTFLYVAIAVLHGLFMHVWVDLYLQNYIIGFVIATAMQILCSYFGNKVLVFKV
ncbi:GtrA family protein [Zwartia panacis]|uniref:GtrA family protein n=1 Tax=Zwartia panacis TaxID=2683345 RepID=UPI0025B32C70|nr:GtrA family protein [Zwartia panacis]MDN4018048.1 GtrA family protein [Zwartia panacis]